MFKMEMYYSLRDKNSSNVVVTMMMMTMMMMTMMTYFIYAQLKYQINNWVKKFSMDWCFTYLLCGGTDQH